MNDTSERGGRKVKCVVWDLDETLWRGTLVEQSGVVLRAGIRDIVRELDRRGVLQSIASRNDYEMAMQKLREFGLDEYFLVPQIGWGAKSASIATIVKELNLGIDALAFVDDDPVEFEEVRFVHGDVLCIFASESDSLLTRPELTFANVTEDARRRRKLYQSDLERKRIESSFEGPKEAFLASLRMVLKVDLARPGDLDRAEELVQRTHQLNTTGYPYSRGDLEGMMSTPDHLVLIASLDDKYGPYGKIGLIVIARDTISWTVKLLLMSCRVMARGVGGALVQYVRNLAREAGVQLFAEFVHTAVNRMMYMTYRFAHFSEYRANDGVLTLQNDLTQRQPIPQYLELLADGSVTLLARSARDVDRAVDV